MTLSEDLRCILSQSIGLTRGVVRVVPADPNWPVLYHRFAAELVPQLPVSVVALEHVGSTAIAGLAAKPILDIAVGVRPGADANEATVALQDFGFLHRGDAGGAELDRNFGFELQHRVRLVNAHLVRYAGLEWVHYLSFRDRLRSDAQACDEYARLKTRLADQHPADRQAYLDGKDAFVIHHR